MKEKEILNNVNMTAAKNFMSNTSSEYIERTSEKSVVFDTKWILKFEEIFPYIENIIRNPRRFIVPEEELTIVEKTKKINEETIKHLAKHTSLIKDVDDDGFVHPSKLLNIYKEETFDLYENRFLYSLIKNLKIFIDRAVTKGDYESYSNSKKTAAYNGETDVDGEKVKIKLDIELDSKKEENVDIKNINELIERINHLEEVIYGWSVSEFIKSLSQAVPVKSPITKTNVFLKEKNFQKALELWEFLEMYMDMDLTSETSNSFETRDQEKKDDFDFIYYISYNMISGKNKLEDFYESTEGTNFIYKFIENFVMDNEGKEKDLKKMIDNQYRIAINKRKKVDKEVINVFRKIVLKYNKRKRKALN